MGLEDTIELMQSTDYKDRFKAEYYQFNLGKAKCTEMAKAFLEILENAGYYAGMYCSSYYLTNFFDSSVKDNYTMWVAHYGVSTPSYPGNYDIWQYSSDGSVPGINHRCERGKLIDFLDRWNRGALGFQPDCPFDLLDRQLRNMTAYEESLEERAKIEKIEL